MRLQQVHVRKKEVEVHNKAVTSQDMGSFKYPISRGKVVKRTLTQGSFEFAFNLPDTTQIPNHMVPGFMKVREL